MIEAQPIKVLIHYSPSPRLEVFEGARLRKTLKACCEQAGIVWLDTSLSKPDIAHFLSPKDESKLNDFKESGVKTVVSAFYAEHDPDARFLRVGRKGKLTLSRKAKRMLAKADLITVPSQKAVDFLRFCGVSGRIEVLLMPLLPYMTQEPPSKRKPGESYFAIMPGDKVCVCLGSFKNREGLKGLEETARLLPDVRFYFFGATKHAFSASYNLAVSRSLSNMHVYRLTSGDLFRSLLSSAKAYLVTDPAPDFIGMGEAMASSSSVVVIGSKEASLYDEGLVCSFAKDAKEAAVLLQAVYNLGCEESIMQAAKSAKSQSIARGAARLSELYGSLLGESTHENE